MGNCVALNYSCDQTVNQIFRCLCGKGHIRNLKENLRALKREMEDLKAIQQQVKHKVEREEAQHRQRLEPVQVWLTRVQRIDTRVIDLLSTSPVQLQKLCLCGLCSKSVCSSYQYGKSVFMLLKEVKILKSESGFKEVSELAPTYVVEERPTRPTVGHETILEEAWNRINEDGVGIMGLHGMGGVGKTTLFKKIHNKLAGMGGFDFMIWVVVSQGTKNSKLQEDIAQKLHLCGDEWTNKNESDKATDIHGVLKGKRFVLMLDDVWEKVDLEAIGVPFPTRENGCKVAFTTRSRKVCGQMGDHEPMQVKCLERNEAWELFKNKVGDNNLSDHVIVQLARKVAEKCHGLPLALSVIGETMASQTTVQEWEHANKILATSAAEFSDMENKILPILKYSYDSLVDENIKSCFLYCALFPEDGLINKEELMEYWICERFLGECQVIKRAENKGHEVLGTLVRANLLMEVNTNTVAMHDVIREMALWIASCFGKQKETFFVQARAGLPEMPRVEDWGAVRRMSLMNNDIEEINWGSKCSEVTTLLLQNNDLKNLLREFIRSMKKLVVLNLSENKKFSELPEQISELASLRYLDLSFTSIEKLPVGFQKLKNLTHLNLTGTKRLSSISGVSKLSSLRSLKLHFSNVYVDVDLVKELQLLEHLQVLSITISTVLGLEKLSRDQRLANCIDILEICYFQQTTFNISMLMRMENLRVLNVVESNHVWEINTNLKCKERETNSSYLHNPTSPRLINLCSVHISSSHSIKDLTWLMYTPNLAHLSIKHSEEVEEIINKEKATNLSGISPFQKLEWLWLESLSKLESIYWSPLPFPLLRKIVAINCPKLKKLPLDVTSVPRLVPLGGFKIIMDPLQQKMELEWEDEETKSHFFPFFDR
ncbi:unnamed protein product [Thlaspi arvense]|uniref:NB-ARC domain-containing protein n=1 Tax=Thlaspi arvense TaxID=13288 RepID=A0AAU9RUA7_THLAR|nr:unnamed protein product [Thlaspi arvense]